MKGLHTTLPLLLCCALTGCDAKKPSPADTPTSSPKDTTSPQGERVPTKGEAPKAQQATPTKGDVVFDLVDNRHLAHRHQSGLLIDFGHGSALKYVQGRWKNPWYDTTSEQATMIAYPGGIGAVVRFMPPAGATSVVMRLKPALKDQRSDLFLGSGAMKEKKIGSLSLTEGWSTYKVDLPKTLPKNQEVTLRFHFRKSAPVTVEGRPGAKSAAAFDWIRVGTGDEKAPFSRASAWFDVEKKSVTLPKEGALQWFMMPGKGHKLTASNIKGDVTVSLERDGKPAVTKELTVSGIDLSDFAKEPTKVTLSSKGGATLDSPQVIQTTPAKATSSKESPQVILVWLIDTLRADQLSFYNDKSDVKTPNLDAFAKESTVFLNTTVQGNSSLPSSASIFTSHYPPRHKVTKESARLDVKTPVLGEAIKAGGWSTGLFSSNGYVSTKWGFARGFDHEVNPIREGKPADAEYLWPQAKSWLEKTLAKDKNQKIFVYINTSDPHVPYDPPGAQLAIYNPQKPSSVGKVKPRGTGELLHDLAKGKGKLSGAELDYMRQLYKGEITYNDLWFGTMLKDLEAMGLRDKAMVVVTSDHGEEFGEYGRFGHGISVNQELVDIPLVIGYQPWTKSGHVTSRAVEAVDIYPTLAHVAGVPKTSWEGVQGEPLVAELQGGGNEFASPGIAYHNEFLRSARVGDWKYQLFQGDKDPLYRLDYQAPKKGSPRAALDGTDLRETHPIARRMFRDLMAYQVRFDETWQKMTDGSVNNHSAAKAKALDTSW